MQQSDKRFADLWQRHLLPGESSLAAFGIGLALVMLLTTFMSVVWARHTGQKSLAASRQRQIQVVGQLLTSNIEALLGNDDLPRVRSLVLNTAHQQGLSVCRVTSNSGGVLADVDPRQIDTDAIVATDSAPVTSEPGVEIDANANGALYPILLQGRRVAQLEVQITPSSTKTAIWSIPAGMGIASLVSLAALLIFYRSARRKLRTAVIVREALLSLDRDSANTANAQLSADMGEEATAWNGLLKQIDSLRAEHVERRVQGTIHASDDSRSDLNAACDAMADGLLLLDAQQKVRYANGAAAVFLEHSRDTLPGRSLGEVVDDSRIIQASEGVLEKRGSARGIVEWDRRESGAQGVLRFIVRPVRRSDAAALMIIIQDVTQQRIAQESHSAFLAQAAHELRTPLTNIKLHVETAIEQGDAEPTLRAECLNVINSESTRLERIVGDMLSVAEIEAGALSLFADDVQMETILDQLKRDHTPHALHKNLSLKFHMPPKMPLIQGDQDKILLALHNLLGNAIKYTAEGGTVTVEVEAGDEQLSIRVIDTGFGIGEEDRLRIFDKFFRASDDRVREITGSGLGLPLAREVVRMHGGDITFETQLDEGSTFTMTLPVQEAQVTA